MTPEQWQQVKRIFDKASALQGSERQHYLDSACQDDALRDEVNSLLFAAENDGGILDRELGIKISDSLFEDHPLQPESQIGAYRIVKKLGVGGMGVVYLAEQQEKQFRMHVALKIIKRGMDTEDIIARFQNERQILAKLDHPNIAKLFFAGATDAGLPYFAMEYIDGEPINTYYDRLKLDIKKRLQLFMEVCKAVQHAHERKIVHRDLKPSNIYINSHGTPKLLDFGIAKILHSPENSSTSNMTGAWQKLLTPAYASPEQFASGEISPASDVYTLGVLLYELMCGSLPHSVDHRSNEQVLSSFMPKRPSSVCRQKSRDGSDANIWQQKYRVLRGDLDTIVLKCLRKEPEQRYGTAGELADDIQRHFESVPILAQPVRLTYRLQKFFERNKNAIRPIAILAALTASFFILLPSLQIWLFPPQEVDFAFEPEQVQYVQAGRDVKISGLYQPAGVQIQGLRLKYHITSGPNRGSTGVFETNQLGRFEFNYLGSGGIGVDSVRVSNIVDEPNESEIALIARIHWMPPGTLFGPLGFPIGKIAKDFNGGITCEGQRFSASPIREYGHVSVLRTTADQLRISVELKQADPHFSYEVEVFEAGEGCASSTLAATGVILQADQNGNGEAELTLSLPHAPPNHHVLGDGLGSEALIVVLDWTDSRHGGDRFSTDPIPLPAIPESSQNKPVNK